jgi:SAM-dependent methyltransferase
MLPLVQLSSDTDSVTDSGSDGSVDEVAITVSQPLTFADRQYWEDRYKKSPDHCEWYMSWERLKPVIGPILEGRHHCLHIGCGTSSLGAELLQTGIEKVVNIDFSRTIIEYMKAEYVTEPRLEWQALNIIEPTEFKAQEFDLIIDKGTMDSQMCSDVAASNIDELFRDISRILKPGGYFIVVSSGPDELRRFFFAAEEFDWTLQETFKIHKLPVTGTFYYIYIAEKNAEIDHD